ncbi:MAG: DUF6868 family protein [Planctomycetota bacterium]
MTIELARNILGWCTLINAAFLLLWFGFFWLAHDWMYRFHGRLFRISVESFDAIHYAGLAGYKAAILVFNLAPYLALAAV